MFFLRARSLSLQGRTEEANDKEAEKEKEKLKTLLSEITVGVRNVLSRGSCGKGAATGAPVREHRTQSRLHRFTNALQFEKITGILSKTEPSESIYKSILILFMLKSDANVRAKQTLPFR